MPKLSINLTEENYQRLLQRKGKSGASLSWQINDLLESIFRHIDKADQMWLMTLRRNLQADGAQQLDGKGLQASVEATNNR